MDGAAVCDTEHMPSQKDLPIPLMNVPAEAAEELQTEIKESGLGLGLSHEIDSSLKDQVNSKPEEVERDFACSKTNPKPGFNVQPQKTETNVELSGNSNVERINGKVEACHETNDGENATILSSEKDESLNEGRRTPTKSLAEELDKKSNECILEPLEFPETPPKKDKGESTEEKVRFDEVYEAKFSPDETPCILCDNLYKNINEKSQNDEYFCHLIVEHKLVIADVKLIAKLRKYAIYWKKRLAEKPVESFCTVITTNTSPKDIGESEKYFLLCDALTEDGKVREELQLIRLKELIDIQATERCSEDFERMCLFCTKFFIGNRNALFNHLNEDHNFNVGHPHNLIYADDFLNDLEKKLSKLECLFCDNVFKDRASLKEHMRKKAHRRLNPKNKYYDKYYIINYLELGKNWEVLQAEADQLDSAEDWSGWDDEGGPTAVCFFCMTSFSTRDRVFEHMKVAHDFDYPQMRKDMNLSFYQQVKMVNYIRRTVHQLREAEKKEDKATDADEFAKTLRKCISTSTKWNQPQYYFPTYENDTLLCQLEDKEGLFEPEDNFIIGEDGIDCKAIINESILTDLVVQGYFD